MGIFRKATTAAAAGVFFFVGAGTATAQVVAEPAFLTARVPDSEVLIPYIAFPSSSFVIAGMLRFPVTADIDIGGRAGLWSINNSKDTPYAGADMRYALMERPMNSSGSTQLLLSFDVGLGLSDPGPTVWKIPVGVIAGIGFDLAGGQSEVYANPRFEFGISSGSDSTDGALVLDVGGLFTIKQNIGAMIAIRFGQEIFSGGDKAVVGLGLAWTI